MLEDIRKKIEGEMKSDELKPFGRYILDQLLVSEENAEKMGADGKSLKACFDAVKGKAKGHAHSGCAIIEGKTVFKWIREYYGIASGSDMAAKESPAAVPAGASAPTAPIAPAAPKTISLLDLMDLG